MSDHTLKELLDNGGLTQKAVAEVCGVTAHTVGHWVRNDRVPNVGHRLALSRLLQVDLEQIPNGVGHADTTQALYPTLDSIPADVWQQMASNADRADFKLGTGLHLIDEVPLVSDLLRAAVYGKKVARLRVALLDPGSIAAEERAEIEPMSLSEFAERGAEAVERWSAVCADGIGELRTYNGPPEISTYDFGVGGLVVATNLPGMTGTDSPAIIIGGGLALPAPDVVSRYRTSYDAVWESASVAD